SNTTVTTLRDSPALDDAIDFFESHHCVMPTDGLYEVHPRQASDLDWFECNMAELLDLDPTYVTPVIPPEFEVYESHRRPSVLFVPEAPIDFDIESTPLRDKIIDSPHKSSYSEPRRSSRRKTRSEDGRWNSKDKTEQPSPPPRDPNAYESVPVVEPVYKNPSSAVKSRERDWERLRKYFAWLPKLVIQKTFDCTTQLARIPMSAHLQRHYRSPFPALNVNRRSEGVATDTVYADTPDIEHGHVAAQFYVGISSLVSDVYGVNTDAQFLQTLQDNVRKRGAPNKLVSDRAQAEVSKAVKDYLRWLCIDDWQSEPHRQNQNPAERRYQDIKRLANRILDRTGAPPSLWLLALRYASFVYNHTAVQSLGWLTPIQVLTGITPDISVLLRFAFFEKVYYKTEEPSFPSDSPESIGYMVGIAEHVGHAMTYKILNLETNKILFRSEIRSAASPNDPNKRLDPSDGEELTSPTVIKSKSDNVKSVGLVPYIRNVFDTSEQLALQNNNRPLTFDEYASLLEAAAQNHDEVTKGSKPKPNPRKAYATDVVTTGDLEPDPCPPMFDFNIDMDLGDYYAYRTSLSSARKTFLPNELWQQLDDQGRRAWHQLPEAVYIYI
ncbi:unnamed protein product, partial [Cylindrotheca closterium]